MFLTPGLWRTDMKRNYRAEDDGVECRAFRSLGVGHVPKRHVDSVCRRAPKRHTVRQGKLSSRVQVFLKWADGYCVCDCDVFDTAVLQDQSAKERKNA
jgi:hypothetical protein